MKRGLLIILVLSFGLFTYAQQRARVPKTVRDKAVKLAEPTKGMDDANYVYIPGQNSKSILTEEDIGNTWYDVQTNQSMQHRIYLHNDGTMGAVWTHGPQGNPTGADRGTGYNYYDGNSWGPFPAGAIESGAQAGWPSYTTFGESGEAYTCHDYWLGTILGTRDVRGTGEWNLVIQSGPSGAEDISFPRVVTTGPDRNIVHILSTTWVAYNGQENALLYARTSDAGASWEIENQLFDELGTDFTLDLGGDTYDWAEPKAGLMAFLVGDGWMDMVIMKSDDEGDTWEKSVVWECPYPLNGATPTDTFYSPDGSHDIVIDNSGLVHVVFSVTRSLEDGGGHSYFPGDDGVIYWNENRPAFSNDINALNPYGHPDSELEEDYSLIGWSQDINGNDTLDILDEWGTYNTGLSSQPQMIIDDMNQIFVVYSSVTEGYNDGTANYRHIWVRSSPNGGEWWGGFHDLTNALINIFDECVFPSASNTSDENIYFTYQADAIPGTTTTSVDENFTRFVEVAKLDIISGINENEAVIKNDNVSQNYPNPFSGTSTVYVMLEEAAMLSLEVHNLMGQLVYSSPERKYNSGKVEFTIDGSKMESGIYFYSIVAGESSVTKKMIIE
ncbi:MAG: T9SS type A sorting domain-containing protein [Bacteroidales bacterium]|nr:T9SS type A sorting domain-containing protein [Bacteroidales bacterium]